MIFELGDHDLCEFDPDFEFGFVGSWSVEEICSLPWSEVEEFGDSGFDGCLLVIFVDGESEGGFVRFGVIDKKEVFGGGGDSHFMWFDLDEFVGV